jgi:hypothetical protein
MVHNTVVNENNKHHFKFAAHFLWFLQSWQEKVLSLCWSLLSFVVIIKDPWFITCYDSLRVFIIFCTSEATNKQLSFCSYIRSHGMNLPETCLTPKSLVMTASQEVQEIPTSSAILHLLNLLLFHNYSHNWITSYVSPCSRMSSKLLATSGRCQGIKTLCSAHCYTSKCYFGHHLSSLLAKCDAHVFVLSDTVKSAYDKTFLTLSADIKWQKLNQIWTWCLWSNISGHSLLPCPNRM